MTKLTIGGVDYVPADALTRAFADGMLSGNDFGREIARREIRRALAKALRKLLAARGSHRTGRLFHAACDHDTCAALREIDALTKPQASRR